MIEQLCIKTLRKYYEKLHIAKICLKLIKIIRRQLINQITKYQTQSRKNQGFLPYELHKELQAAKIN